VSLDSLGKAPALAGAGRFALVGYLPAYAAASYLLVLVWAGAPGRRLEFGRAWRTAAQLGAGEALLLVVAITLVAVVLQPLQLPLVRLLEGYWPRWWRPATRLGRFRQSRIRRRWRRAAELPRNQAPAPAAVRAAGLADTELRRRFPADGELLRPTRLGNALAAAEERAGGAYGWDTPVVWPRLYPLLGPAVKSIVDDRRNVLDVLCRLSVTGVVGTVASLALLARTGWWLLLAAAPALLAIAAYRAAVHAAYAYGEGIRSAFDLHRFDLYPALHVATPEDPGAERALNESLCAWWRQGAARTDPYAHPPAGAAEAEPAKKAADDR
jgi:hypothetical protein